MLAKQNLCFYLLNFCTEFEFQYKETVLFSKLQIDICSDAIADIQAVHGVSYVCDSLTNLVGKYKIWFLITSTHVLILDIVRQSYY